MKNIHGEEFDPEVDSLDAVDKEILRLKWSNRNLTLTQIGNLLPEKISKQAVHQRIQRPKFKEIWDRLEKDVIWRLKEAQDQAVVVLLRTLKSNDQKLAFQAAKTILEPILQNHPGLLPEVICDEELEIIKE